VLIRPSGRPKANPAAAAHLQEHRAHLAERLAKARLAAGDAAVTGFVPSGSSAE
jgi:hypothetical protein